MAAQIRCNHMQQGVIENIGYVKEAKAAVLPQTRRDAAETRQKTDDEI